MGRRGEITVDDVLNSRMICSPLHLLDCAIDNEGGYAIVVTSGAVARNCRQSPVWVLGGAEAAYTDFYTTIQDPWFPRSGNAVRRVGDMVFDMAGVSRDDIDVAGLYDCFTITMLRDLEELGFCKLGEGAAYFARGPHPARRLDALQHRRRPAVQQPQRQPPRACTPSRWSGSCAANAACGRCPERGSGCRWPRARRRTGSPRR